MTPSLNDTARLSVSTVRKKGIPRGFTLLVVATFQPQSVMQCLHVTLAAGFVVGKMAGVALRNE